MVISSEARNLTFFQHFFSPAGDLLFFKEKQAKELSPKCLGLRLPSLFVVVYAPQKFASMLSFAKNDILSFLRYHCLTIRQGTRRFKHQISQTPNSCANLFVTRWVNTMVLGINYKYNDIAIYDGKDHLLTDIERQKKLFHEGYRYEASAAQALMIETLCSMYMGVRHQAYRVPIVDRNGKNVGLKPNATFGRVVSLLISSNAFHVSGIEDNLNKYVKLRNELIHEVSGTSSSFDFQAFFELGIEIIKMLKPHFEETFKRIQLNANNHTC
jgi:hypothetical protein